jgi:3-hydroxy-9,10-secoandrosta-1,3,5(10)-triene-9,17-dione monooxygenase reductase component
MSVAVAPLPPSPEAHVSRTGAARTTEVERDEGVGRDEGSETLLVRRGHLGASGRHMSLGRGLNQASTAAIDPRRFRRVLGHLPTGVTVIAAYGVDAPVGMTANSVTSVSLDPPMILFCPAKSSSTWPRIRATGAFCVNVLAGHHEELTRQFAAKGIDRFSGVAYEERPTGPALIDAIAWIECVLYSEQEAGDHMIALARVISIETRAVADPEPLVFFRGRYGSFRTPAPH